MTFAQTWFAVILMMALFMVAAQYKSYQNYNPIVLNSLPATKIKCRPGAMDGWCAKGYTVKQYEAMQND